MNTAIRPGTSLSSFRLGDVLGAQLRSKPGKTIEVKLATGETIQAKTTTLRPQTVKGRLQVETRVRNYALVQELRSTAALAKNLARRARNKLDQVGWFKRELVELKKILESMDLKSLSEIEDPETRKRVSDLAKANTTRWKINHKLANVASDFRHYTQLAQAKSAQAQIVVNNLGSTNPLKTAKTNKVEIVSR